MSFCCSVILEATSCDTNLSERPKIFPDGFLCGLRVQPPNKDLDRIFLHGHRSLGVNGTPVQSVFLLLQHLQVQQRKDDSKGLGIFP